MFSFRFALLLSLIAQGASADLSGPVHVVDGDTLIVADERVRLHGIDTFEKDQFCGGNGTPAWPCGAWVSDTVRARYEGRMAVCEQTDFDGKYQRVVARCTVDGEDIGRALVAEGLAFAYRRYSMDYDIEEKRAAVRGLGIHGEGGQIPERFRRTRQRAKAAIFLTDAPEGCAIKGNISKAGQIFHMPGQADYDRTRISPEKGERWFCSAAEAEAAGWRKARR